MSEAVLFDTNILPVHGGLDGPLWMSIRKLCEIRGMTMYLPELVLEEAINMRRTKAEVAHARFIAAQSELDKLFPVEAVYVPDIEEIVDAWEEDLRSTFTMVESHGADAREALIREARRSRPAREGRGGRDAGIWLTALRCAAEHEALYFVSNNTKDFGLKKSPELHPALVEEARAAGLSYFTSTYPLLDLLASTAEEPAIDLAKLAKATHSEFIDVLLRDGGAISVPAIQPEDVRDGATVFNSLTVQRTYDVESQLLVLVSGDATLATEERDLPLEATMWLTLDAEEIVAVEVVRLVATDVPEE